MARADRRLALAEVRLRNLLIRLQFCGDIALCMPTFATLAESIRVSAIAWFCVFVLLTWIEFAFPRDRHSLGRRFANLAFWAVTIPVTVVTSAYLSVLWRWVGIGPVVTIPLDFGWMGPLSYVFAAITAAIIGDFFQYWFHRAQHKWLWKYHAVHHSIKELNAVNSYAHVSESTFQNLFIVIPTSLILVDTGPALPILVIIMRLYPVFIHSPVKIHFGMLRCVFVDNRIHRIHHSMERRHFDKNFGVFTTLWDQLFGTAYFPQHAEWPETGIHEADEPRTVSDWLSMPWRLPSSVTTTRTEMTNDPVTEADNESAPHRDPSILAS